MLKTLAKSLALPTMAVAAIFWVFLALPIERSGSEIVAILIMCLGCLFCYARDMCRYLKREE